MDKDKKNEIETDPKLKNQIPIHKKSSSYGGYGGNSPANMDGAINEFEDNAIVDSDESEDEQTINNELNTNDSKGQESEDLDRNRAEGFDRVKNGTKKQEKTESKENKKNK